MNVSIESVGTMISFEEAEPTSVGHLVLVINTGAAVRRVTLEIPQEVAFLIIEACSEDSDDETQPSGEVAKDRPMVKPVIAVEAE